MRKAKRSSAANFDGADQVGPVSARSDSPAPSGSPTTNFIRKSASNKGDASVRRHAKAPSAGSTSSRVGSIRRAFATRGASSDFDGSGALAIRHLGLGSAIGLSLLLLGVVFLATARPAAADCANEAIRVSASSNVNPVTGQPYSAGLPECRAYEKVTPEFKQANNASSPNFPFSNIPPDGTAFGFEAGVYGTFLARRGAEGWSSSDVAPPRYLIGAAAGFFGFAIVSYSTDVSSVVQCGYVVQSASYGAWSPANPIACAVRNPLGQWQLGRVYKSIDGYASGATSYELLGLSADQTHLVISSQVRLLPGDTAPGSTGTLYEMVNPTTPGAELRLVNVDNSGSLIGTAAPSLGSAGNNFQAVSADGSTIYFTATPTGGVATLYARKNGASTTAISNPVPAECTTCDPTAKAATYVGASSDGKRAFFTTTQQLVNADTDTTSDLYEYDFEGSGGHRLTQVSGGGSGDLSPGSGAGVQGVVQVSEDGTHSYFLATGALTTIPNGVGQVATTGSPNLYVFERDAEFPQGRTRFVATLLAGEANALVGNSSQSQATPDGRYLTFGTAASLITSGPEVDTDAVSDIYRYNAQTGELNRVSVGMPSYPASNNGNTAGMKAILYGSRNVSFAQAEVGRASISDDGSAIVFGTPEKLQAEDSNGGSSASNCQATGDASVGCDVYLWRDGVVRLISDSQASARITGITLNAKISAAGTDVFFLTSSQLVPQDTDELADIYDARVDGGFAYSPPPAPCEANEACHGAPPAPPAAGSVASTAFSGPGNEPVPAAKKQKKKKPHNKKSRKKKAQKKQTSTRRHG